MKSIHTLVNDVYKLVGRKDGWFTADLANALGTEVATKLGEHFNRPVSPPTLRLSQMGPKCPRELWYSIHYPELAEPLSPQAMIKFSYGHILEAMAIMLAKAAGHDVTGEQDELTVLGVKGHRDCVIDGYLVDVKSCNSNTFKAFQDRSLAYTDTFGYLDQLDGYLVGSAEDNLVQHKDVAYDWAIDKTLGKMVLYEHHLREASIKERVASYKVIVALDAPPPCTCETLPDGESGNYKLGVKASYSAFKHVCFPHLRTFIYSNGPRYLTRVVKRPFNKDGPILEVDKYGKYIH